MASSLSLEGSLWRGCIFRVHCEVRCCVGGALVGRDILLSASRSERAAAGRPANEPPPFLVHEKGRFLYVRGREGELRLIGARRGRDDVSQRPRIPWSKDAATEVPREASVLLPECPVGRVGCFSGALRGEGGLLRGQLGELCTVISQNNPTCFKLTWGFAFEGCPKPS